MAEAYFSQSITAQILLILRLTLYVGVHRRVWKPVRRVYVLTQAVILTPVLDHDRPS